MLKPRGKRSPERIILRSDISHTFFPGLLLCKGEERFGFCTILNVYLSGIFYEGGMGDPSVKHWDDGMSSTGMTGW